MLLLLFDVSVTIYLRLFGLGQMNICLALVKQFVGSLILIFAVFLSSTDSASCNSKRILSLDVRKRACTYAISVVG